MRRLPILVALVLLSCGGNRVDSRLLPREDGTVTVVSVAREESSAAARNVNEANRYCEKQDRKAVFGAEETEYQGVPMARSGILARVIKNIPGLGSRVTSEDDFRVTTSFRCVVTDDVGDARRWGWGATPAPLATGGERLGGHVLSLQA